MEWLARQAARVQKLAGAVPSPCVSVCRMDAATALCQGCLRTIDEIAVWSRLDDAGRRAIWSRIERRAHDHSGHLRPPTPVPPGATPLDGP